ncbi:MAG: hypothetical protein ED556_05920 [Winogradskyella sp.]|uniref:hypothetical protein n=1 Tax=Winogradskyella sp. TaxID=1883156 RepID=UPI000F40C3DC|nr:hypothetical protein [Winogradskyella sp.]RNC86959.1 MAG: hypothetical protein ED556_05920 [Winogradskyella sp.]
MKKIFKVFACLFLFTAIVNAQQISQKSCSAVCLNRTIQLDGSSDKETITVDVSEDTGKMHLNINSKVESGYLTVELYDPKGNKKGNFSIESQSNSSKTKEQVCGQMQKYIEDPIKGKWSVVLVPKKVVGDVSICTSLYDE